MEGGLGNLEMLYLDRIPRPFQGHFKMTLSPHHPRKIFAHVGKGCVNFLFSEGGVLARC